MDIWPYEDVVPYSTHTFVSAPFGSTGKTIFALVGPDRRVVGGELRGRGHAVVGPTLIATVAGVLCAPWLSVTVRLAVQVQVEYVWGIELGTGAVAARRRLPSPKSSVHDAIEPSGSELPEPSNVTVSGSAAACVLFAVSTAVGGTSVLPLRSRRRRSRHRRRRGWRRPGSDRSSPARGRSARRRASGRCSRPGGTASPSGSRRRRSGRTRRRRPSPGRSGSPSPRRSRDRCRSPTRSRSSPCGGFGASSSMMLPVPSGPPGKIVAFVGAEITTLNHRVRSSPEWSGSRASCSGSSGSRCCRRSGRRGSSAFRPSRRSPAP